MTLACAWARPGKGAREADPEDAHDAAINAWIKKDEGEGSEAGASIEIPPDEADAVVLFLALSTQWRFLAVPMTGIILRIGLDYGVIREVAAMSDVAWTPSLLVDLKDMEQAVIRADREAAR